MRKVNFKSVMWKMKRDIHKQKSFLETISEFQHSLRYGITCCCTWKDSSGPYQGNHDMADFAILLHSLCQTKNCLITLLKVAPKFIPLFDHFLILSLTTQVRLSNYWSLAFKSPLVDRYPNFPIKIKNLILNRDSPFAFINCYLPVGHICLLSI